jgi:hypothetical protein
VYLPVGNVADEVVARPERHGIAVGQHPSGKRRLLAFTFFLFDKKRIKTQK